MRVAAVDIGTNTVLLLVAEVDGAERLRPVLERSAITRLGEGVDQTRCFLPAAVARTCAAIRDLARDAAAFAPERCAVVGTSAMRDAAGGAALRACVTDAFGVEARVLTGDEEARLTFAGALSGLAPRSNPVVFDIGGGSTEVVLGTLSTGPRSDKQITYAKSFDVGSVRLTERHIRGDPPTRCELEAIRDAARRAFAAVPDLESGQEPVGIAGTITTLAAVALGMEQYDGAALHGTQLATRTLASTVDSLATISLADRRRVAGLQPQRADVIVAGGLIALALLEHWAAESVVVSDRGVRWGVAEELAVRAP